MEDNKPKKPEEKSPFELLLEAGETPVDLGGLKAEEHREGFRLPFNGQVVLTNQTKAMKAVIRNISPTGLGVETPNFTYKVGDAFQVDFGGDGIGISGVTCTIQWVAEVDNVTRKNKIIGLRFQNLSAENAQKIKIFFDKLQQEAYKFL